MRFHRKGNLTYLTFGIFDQYPEVMHAVFTRLGGLSAGPFSELNIGRNIGDNPDSVMLNRQALAKCLASQDLLFLSQVHGTGIIVSRETGRSRKEEVDTDEADGVISNKPGKMMIIQTADCQSIMLYDPKNKTVANIHAGWRGSIGNIIGKCIDLMKTTFDSDPNLLVAAIGPSLGPCCAEFINYKKEIPEKFHRYKDNQNRFNFWRISHDQLTQSGLSPDNIECSNICTKCNPHLFFSYRNSKITGRFASAIGLCAGKKEGSREIIPA